MNIQKVYREIARRQGISVQDVKKQMQEAIAMAWENPDKTALQASVQSEISIKGTVPTPEELIRYAQKKLR